MSIETTAQEATPINTFASKPRLIVHVGKGLGRFHGLPEEEIRSQLENRAWKGNLAALGNSEFDSLRQVMLIAPEHLRDERDAALEVLKTFSAKRQLSGTALAVVTLSQNVLSAIIDAVVQIDFHDELAVCVHSEKDGEISVHRLNDDGVLQDWPYGCLQALLDQDDLAPFDFAALRKRVDLINGKK